MELISTFSVTSLPDLFTYLYIKELLSSVTDNNNVIALWNLPINTVQFGALVMCEQQNSTSYCLYCKVTGQLSAFVITSPPSPPSPLQKTPC